MPKMPLGSQLLRRLRFLTAFSLMLIAIGMPGYIALHRSPAGVPDDSDLSVTMLEATPSDNGLDHLLEAVSMRRLTDADISLLAAHVAGEDIETNDVSAVLANNAPALKRLRQAINTPTFLLPEAAADEFEFAPEIPLETEYLIYLLRSQSLLNAQQESWDIAFDNALDILRLARKLEGADRAVLTTTMLSVGYRAAALETLQQVIAMAPLDKDRAQRWLDALPDYRSDASAWKRMWAVEYQQWKSLLAWISDRAEQEYRAGGQGGPAVDFSEAEIQALKKETQRTLAAFADMTRAYQRVSENDCLDLEALPAGPGSGVGNPSKEESEGLADLAISVNAPDYRDFFVRRCTQDTALAATQTLIALKAFQQDLGRLPEHLGDLVPNYLEAIPTDTFGGDPIQYSRAEKMLYSRGTSAAREGLASPPDAAFALHYPIEF